MILLFLLLVPASWAGVCEDSWARKNPAKVLETCRLEWSTKDGGQALELAKLATGCSLEDDWFDCSVLRTCGKGIGGETGVTVFRSFAPATSYCLTGMESEIFDSDAPGMPKAYLSCRGVRMPSQIKLVSPDGKKTKTCPFPKFGKP